MDLEATRRWIEQWEGRRNRVYTDSAGHPTIGVGFNLDRQGARERITALGLDYDAVRAGRQQLTDQQIDTLLTEDVNSAVNGARGQVSNFDQLPDRKQMVVVDMVFNLGSAGFGGFHNLIQALQAQDWARAAQEMQNSRWYGQVGNRARADVGVMREPTGTPSPQTRPQSY